MLRFKGRLAIIKEVLGKDAAYKLDIDNKKWYWSSDMFSIINKNIEIE